MKRTILLLVALALLSAASLPAATRQTSSSTEKQAPADTTKKIQLSERARKMVERRLDRLNQVLNLTPEQQKKIRGILEKA
ncbi:MAG: hypothetical protein GXO73_07390, partial [Calditrichaeota bacterium]|nr:hypothetical protein [Calditrichota bacterium]